MTLHRPHCVALLLFSIMGCTESLNGIGILGVRCARSTPCTENGARHLARAYRLSVPFVSGRLDPQILPSSALSQYVAAHRDVFTERGDASQCGRDLGARLIASGIHTYDPDEKDSAIEQWGGSTPLVAKRAAEEMTSGRLDVVNVGRELSWLGQVLPQVAKGNLAPYNKSDTPTRKQVQQAVARGNPTSQPSSPTREHVASTATRVLDLFGPHMEALVATLGTSAAP